MQAMESVQKKLSREARGVHVQASTLGSLEALLEFLATIPIPVASFNIGACSSCSLCGCAVTLSSSYVVMRRAMVVGPVSKRDVMSAAIMLEHKTEFATILAFDVPVTQNARLKANIDGVKIFTADIIYHLFDQFTAYLDEIKEKRRAEAKNKAVFPCRLEILPQYIFNKKNPIIVGVKVLEGIVKAGTPLCFIKNVAGENAVVTIGTITSVERNNEPVQRATVGQEVAINIQQGVDHGHIMYGRQFDAKDILYSVLTRESIDLLKENFKDDLTKNDWQTVINLKAMFNIL